MKIYDVRVVHMSDLLDGIPYDIRESITDSDTGIGRKFTWGDCNRSLVNRMNLLSVIDDCCDTSDETPEGVAVGLVRSRIVGLPGEVYIDLEN